MYPLITENDTVKNIETLVEMSDGVKLYTRITTPVNGDKFPIVYMRTPYEKSHEGKAHDIDLYNEDLYIKNGYALILQHCRGTGDSEGICIPYNERDDGLETLEFIRSLDIYNGEIYLRGWSYLATVHLSYLNTNPEDIKGAALDIQTDRMFFRNYRNGCNYDYCNYKWWLNMMKRQYPEPNIEEPVKRPYKDLMTRILGEDVPEFTGTLINNTYNDFWKNDPRTNSIENLKIPILLTEGWYDFYIEGMFSMWQRLPAQTREKSVFMVGPWGHAKRVTEQAEYPIKDGNLPEGFFVEWFNSIRENRDFKFASRNKVHYFSLGANRWTEAEYPVKNADTEKFCFVGGNALSKENTAENESLSYTYDPEKRLGCFRYNSILKAAPAGETDGVLSFISEPFEEDESFFGQVGWEMNVSSDCEDTAFFMRIHFEEDGIFYNVTETITTLSHITPDYRPGDKIKIALKTPPTAFTVKKGNRIRVDIASDGGIYVPHANVKGHWALVTETKVAKNTVYLKDAFVELTKE